jgi:hypothetical protein
MGAITAPFTGQETALYASDTALTLAGASASTLVGEVQNLGDMELSANVIEVSTYGSAYKQKLVGQKDSGTLDITLNWVPDASAQSEQALLQASYSSGAKVHFAIIWNDGANQAGCTFSGYVQSYGISQPLEDVVTVNVSINIEGAVVLDTDGTL